MQARWYSVSRDGAATLCVDEEDALANAAHNELAWPNGAPHRAVMLCDAAEVQRHLQNLAMMLRKCAHRLKCNGHEDLSADVVGLLRRYDLLGSPLRGAEAEHG